MNTTKQNILGVFGAIAIAYFVACCFYLIATRGLGTPFNDSLTPEQVQIKKESAAKRSKIFMASFAVSSLAVLAFYLVDKNKCKKG